MSIRTTGDGQIIIDLPRALIDAKCIDRCILPHGTDVPFDVLSDGRQAHFTEIKTSTDRTLTIPFTNGTEQISVIVSRVI